ncbi:MAG TPA: hemerythrin domain-containing protein [Sphingorhabdus sp.]|jgi:iron-sulfur cluster repair protein YtfE (RIC family)|nr:hemerythrin domain-containing protein [Sphingorhabdus sp.]
MGITGKLREDHDALLGLVGMFRDILRQPVAPTGVDLVKFRSAFSKELLAHLTREDWLLYPSLLQSSDKVIAGTAQKFIDEMGGLLGAYKLWSAEWPTERIIGNWQIFVTETSDLLGALEQRIDRENNELYPLVETVIVKAA